MNKEYMDLLDEVSNYLETIGEFELAHDIDIIVEQMEELKCD